MKFKIAILCIGLLMAACGPSAQNKNDQTTKETRDTTQAESEKNKTVSFSCTSFNFSNSKEQADSLLLFMEKSTSGDATEEVKFFCAFPNSFDEMEALFGYDDDEGAAPLYEQGEAVIGHFQQLKTIPHKEYYSKYINICIEGSWKADNMREAFGLAKSILEDTEIVTQFLQTFSEEEVKSVFHFIFDGPNPYNEENEALYKRLKTKLDKENQQLSLLLTKSYENLTTE